MTLLATFKHISSKNADYGAAEQYLTFEHDEFTMKPTLDENGRLMLREDYRIATLNCGDEDFAGSSFPDTKPLSAPTRTDTTTAAISMCISLSILCG